MTPPSAQWCAQTVLEQMPMALGVVDADGTVRFANARWAALFGVPVASLQGVKVAELASVVMAGEADALASAIALGKTWRGQLIRRSGGSEPQPLEVAAEPMVGADGSVQGAVLMHGHAPVAVATNTSPLPEAMAAHSALVGLFECDLDSGWGRYSPRWLAVAGRERAPATVAEWFSQVHPDDRGGLDAAFRAHLRGETPHVEHEHRLFAGGQAWRWVQVRALALPHPAGESGRPLSRLAGSMVDISERKLSESRLYHAASHDGLTGLPNRSLFRERVAIAVRRDRRKELRRFALLFLDLDGFKRVNDSLGHLVGDRLLVEVARRLEPCVRGVDTVARLGGDEFGVLLDEVNSPSEASAAAARIERSLANPFEVDGHHIVISASIGVVCSDEEDTVDQLLRDADAAMYEVRSRGRGGHHIVDPATRERRARRARLGSALRESVRMDGLEVVYQPVVSLVSGAVLGLEALARWNHPDHGAVPPGEFVPLAEELGLIDRLGLQVMRDSCAQAAVWVAQHGPLFVNVNVSARQFRDPRFVEHVIATQRDAELPAGTLGLEITETVLVDRPEALVAMLCELRSGGVQLALDDFGTGFSSLSHLRRFPVHTVKIDRTFVGALIDDDTTRHIVRAIISLAQALGISAVAEGIETVEQAAMLRSIGCTVGQGYLFARPMPAADVSRLLASRALSV